MPNFSLLAFYKKNLNNKKTNKATAPAPTKINTRWIVVPKEDGLLIVGGGGIVGWLLVAFTKRCGESNELETEFVSPNEDAEDSPEEPADTGGALAPPVLKAMLLLAEVVEAIEVDDAWLLGRVSFGARGTIGGAVLVKVTPMAPCTLLEAGRQSVCTSHDEQSKLMA